MTSAHESRRPRTAKRFHADQWAKGLIGPVVVLAIIAAVSAGMYFTSKEAASCPGHWHATLHVYVHDDRVEFPQPPYNFGGDSRPGHMRLAFHMHAPDSQQIHIEPSQPECTPFADLVSDRYGLGFDFDKDSITFEGDHGPVAAGTYENGDEGTLRVFYAKPSNDYEWDEIDPGTFAKRQLQDGEKILIVFGNHSDEEISAMQDQVPVPSAFGGAASHGA